MADDNNVNSTSEAVGAVAPVEAPAPKKQRGPRRKTAAEATTAVAPVTKSAKGTRRKRGEQLAEAKPAAVEAPVAEKVKATAAVKGTRKYGAGKQAKQTGKVSAATSDEFADLIQLEEENKKLRKSLSDKLRSENADLRKRLGLA